MKPTKPTSPAASAQPIAAAHATADCASAHQAGRWATGARFWPWRGRHLNFRAAADELALTQSAVSRQIQALEEEVGVPLFLRHTRAVELTTL